MTDTTPLSNAQAYLDRGVLFHESGQLQLALEHYAAAIGIDPEYAEAYSNQGVCLHALGRFDEALASYARALELKPHYAIARYNRGLILHNLGRLEAALRDYQQVIQAQPEHAQAYYNCGLIMRSLGRWEEAKRCYSQAIEIDPHFADAHWNLGLCHLLLGNFRKGWEGYEWRWRRTHFPSIKRKFGMPQWQGHESLRDKTILLHGEQGFGDTIQFCRYAPLVADRGARVILEVQGALFHLFSRLDGIAQVIPLGTPLPDADYHSPLLSLPRAFNTEVDTIPCWLPRIDIDRSKAVRWFQRFAEKKTLRVGIAWTGSETHEDDSKRSVSFEKLISFLPVGPEYVSLQKELRPKDAHALALHPQVRHFGADLQDFRDTAVVCDLMDLVISVDTAVAHLAGTIGKPTWLLLPHTPDWRWMRERDDSPWYPKHRLFRQKVDGDWDKVLDEVSDQLSRLLRG